MSEEIETAEGAIGDSTESQDSSYGEILAPKGTDGESSVPAEKAEEVTETQDQQPPKQEDEEIVLELGGKSFTMKQSEAIELLESASKFAEREKVLAEKEKSLNRDYTQKTQALAEVRKSLETSFGRMPQAEELSALSKVWKAYFENPQAQDILNQIIAGTFHGGVSPQSTGKQDAYTQQLQSKIAQLEERLEQFLSTNQEKEQQKTQVEAQNLWKSWVEKKSSEKVQISEEVDAAMAPFVVAIRNAHPEWEAHRILDEAYRHATIDTLKTDTAKKVLLSADEAKKRGTIRITPKTPMKSEKEMGYKDIVQEAMSA